MTNRKEYMKKYQQEHKEAFRIATQKYRDKNRKKYNEHNNEYRKRKRKEAKENAKLVIKQKEVLDKIKEIVDKAPCLWCVDEEFERVDGTIELSYKEYTGWKDILELLEEIE